MMAIKIPTNRKELEELAQQIVNEIHKIDKCLDETIERCQCEKRQ